MERPTIDSTGAMRQAAMTMDSYLSAAIQCIDAKFGEGYAEDHPDLVAAMVKAQVDDYNSTAFTAVLYEIADAIGGRDSIFSE